MAEMKLIREDQFGKVYEHESFGVISFGRFSGGDNAFFGSSITHHHGGVSLVISHAELHRSLNRDSYFDKETIIRVEMTNTQFADAITSFHEGMGTPVTIKYIAGEGRKDTAPFQSKVVEFNEEFKDTMEEIASNFDKVIALAKQTKAQVRLQKEIEGLKQRMRSNFPFITTQFTEQMAKTVTEAKGEVESFFNNLIDKHGLENLRNMTPQLVEAIERKEVKDDSN